MVSEAAYGAACEQLAEETVALVTGGVRRGLQRWMREASQAIRAADIDEAKACLDAAENEIALIRERLAVLARGEVPA